MGKVPRGDSIQTVGGADGGELKTRALRGGKGKYQVTLVTSAYGKGTLVASVARNPE